MNGKVSIVGTLQNHIVVGHPDTFCLLLSALLIRTDSFCTLFAYYVVGKYGILDAANIFRITMSESVPLGAGLDNPAVGG